MTMVLDATTGEPRPRGDWRMDGQGQLTKDGRPDIQSSSAPRPQPPSKKVLYCFSGAARCCDVAHLAKRKPSITEKLSKWWSSTSFVTMSLESRECFVTESFMVSS